MDRENIKNIILNSLCECSSGDGTFVLDGKWYAPKYGCDTLDHIIDDLQEEEKI